MKNLILLVALLSAFYSYTQIPFSRTDFIWPSNGVQNVLCIDYDNDGDLDVFTAASNDNEVYFFPSLNGIFVNRFQLTGGLAGANVLKSIDFDNDGDLDIVASGSTPGNHTICWWENVNNTFPAKKIIANVTNQAFQDFSITDIDKDGDYDIMSISLSPSMGPGFLTLWKNEDFQFELNVISENCIDGRQIEIEDWDTDGDLDLLIAEGLGNRLALWENQGNSTFLKSTLFNCNICNAFDVEDIDHDGDKDIVALSFIDDEISLWINDGSNNLTEVSIEDQLNGPDEVLIEDMDKDGDFDIIASFYLEDALVVYENDGSLNFVRNTIDLNFNGARDIYITDFDLDNSPDIIGASLTDNKVIIWENDLVISGVTSNIRPSTLIYPNPAEHQLFIESNISTLVNYNIYNSIGSVVKSGTFQNRIDISDLSCGVYYVVITQGNNTSSERLVIY